MAGGTASKAISLTQRTSLAMLGNAEAQASGNSREKIRWTVWKQLKIFIFSSWLNLGLIPLVISGFAVRYTNQTAPVIFVVNSLAILLLGSWLSFATKELALRAGGLAMALVVVLGNAIQLIVTMIALIQGQTLLVKTSLVGSVVSNMVLLTGLALITGGHNRMEQYFDVASADMQLNYLFLVIGVAGIATFFNRSDATITTPSNISLAPGIDQISRASSIILICGHMLFLYWIFSRPERLYAVESQTSSKLPGRSIRAIARILTRQRHRLVRNEHDSDSNEELHSEEEDDGKPQISAPLAIFILVFFTILIGFCATFAVESVDSLTSGVLTKTFVGFILFPIFSYNFDAVFLAREDRLDYVFVITIGGSMQIIALILPLAVIVGWVAGKNDMVIVFDGFQVTILEVSCVMMKYICAYGATNWLHGVILLVFYFIVAISAWYYPDSPIAGNV